MPKRHLLLGLVTAFSIVAIGAAPATPPVGTSLGQPLPDAAPSAPPARVIIAGEPVLGDADAPVTIVEFIDYQCPYCQAYAKETMPRLRSTYVDTGKVRYVARDFPLSSMHQRARPAAIVAACARAQGKFWEMHEALLTEGGGLAEADFARLAARIGLDPGKLAACRDDERNGEALDAAIAAARAAGVSVTPSFLVGASRGTVAEGRLLRGAPTYEQWGEVLSKYLPAN